MARPDAPHFSQKQKIVEMFGKRHDRKNGPSRREQEYKGPAILVSEAGDLPIRVVKFLGKLDEPSGPRYKFAAVLTTPHVERRIQGGVWAERVKIPRANFFRKWAVIDSISDSTNKDLPQIPEGYKGPAMLVDEDCAIPIYVGGIGEETGEGFARARLDLPEGQLRLEGEIDAAYIRVRPQK